MKLTIDLKAVEGDKVKVLNTRKKPPVWEDGKVSLVEIRLSNNSSLYAVYRVVLDRLSERKSYMAKVRGIVLYVGEDKIKKSLRTTN